LAGQCCSCISGRFFRGVSGEGSACFRGSGAFVSLIFGVGFALDLLQIFQAVLERRGNRSAFLSRVSLKKGGVFRPVLENGCRS